MPTISDSLVLTTLSSGNRALYRVQPQHMNMQHYGATLNDAAISYGEQVAHQSDGRWYRFGTWEEITDHRTIALIERAIES